MNTNVKRALIAVGVLLVAWAIWAFAINPEEAPQTPESNNQTENQPGASENETQSPEQEGVWYGRLEQSTAPSRGNLMLMVQDSDRVIYIRTSRDFSSLIGQDVKVTVDGDISAFTLLNIEAQ